MSSMRAHLLLARAAMAMEDDATLNADEAIRVAVWGQRSEAGIVGSDERKAHDYIVFLILSGSNWRGDDVRDLPREDAIEALNWQYDISKRSYDNRRAERAIADIEDLCNTAVVRELQTDVIDQKSPDIRALTVIQKIDDVFGDIDGSLAGEDEDGE